MTSPSNKIRHLLTVQRRRSTCSSTRHQTSSRHHFGLQIVQTSQPGRLQDGLLQQRVYSQRIQNVDELRPHCRGMGMPDQCVNENAVKQWHRCAYKYTSTSSLLCGCEGRTFRANVIMCQSDSIFSPAWQL